MDTKVKVELNLESTNCMKLGDRYILVMTSEDYVDLCNCLSAIESASKEKISNIEKQKSTAKADLVEFQNFFNRMTDNPYL